MGIIPRDCIVANAALKPPAFPTRIRKSRLEIPIKTPLPFREYEIQTPNQLLEIEYFCRAEWLEVSLVEKR
jgi:hypothetical protein